MAGLLPREHGAWAQLAFPLVTGLVLAQGAAGAFGFAAAAVAAFLSHEPAAILAGLRGTRLRHELGAAAGRRLPVLGLLAVVGLTVAGVWAPDRAWRAAVVPAALGLLLVPLFLKRRLKSLGGELLLASTLAATVLPLGRSGPASLEETSIAAAVWLGAFAPPVVAVHALKRRIRKDRRGGAVVLAAPLTAATVVGLALAAWAGGADSARPVLAVLPPALASLGFAVSAPHPRHLKRVGWSLVGADGLALLLLLVL